MIKNDGFCFVEPPSLTLTDPIIDATTRKAAALARACTTSQHGYRGIHECTGCSQAGSDNRDHYLPDGRMTHSLLVHYVACHRSSLSAADLAFLEGLTEEIDVSIEEARTGRGTEIDRSTRRPSRREDNLR